MSVSKVGMMDLWTDHHISTILKLTDITSFTATLPLLICATVYTNYYF